jgi:hypothetical protein
MLRLVTDATVEPVTLAEVKAWLDITATTWDAKLTAGIKSARMQIEKLIGQALAKSTYKYYVEITVGESIELPYPPIFAISSVKSVDENGAETTVPVTDYKLQVSRFWYYGSGNSLIITYQNTAEGTSGESLNEIHKLMIKKQVAFDYRNAFESKGIDEEVMRMARLETINLGV